MTRPVFETTAAALREKSKLRRHFRRFDMLFYLICTVVTIDTIGAVASNGAQGFTWLIFLGVFFFLPYALSVAELGSAFPQEGGPYVWSRLAFGRPLAAVNSVITAGGPPSASRRSGAGRRNSGRFRRIVPSSCGRASRTGGTTRRPT
jgi:amino acid transporter